MSLLILSTVYIVQSASFWREKHLKHIQRERNHEQIHSLFISIAAIHRENFSEERGHSNTGEFKTKKQIWTETVYEYYGHWNFFTICGRGSVTQHNRLSVMVPFDITQTTFCVIMTKSRHNITWTNCLNLTVVLWQWLSRILAP